MPISKTNLKAVNQKPADFTNWVTRVQQAAQQQGLKNLSTVTDHHLMPQNQIFALRNAAIDASSDGNLSYAGKYAAQKGVVANTGDDAAKLDALMQRIVWSFGNVVPGPENVLRIDDPMGTGGWEQAGALTKAYEYANTLKALLSALGKSVSNKAWEALIDHVNPTGTDNAAAQKDICDWADAWATHPLFKIYTRLSQSETRAARSAKQTKAGFGAWINGEHSELKRIGTKLGQWNQTIDASIGQDKDAAKNAMRQAIGGNCSNRWLDAQPPLP